jgi:hypothetical protein
MSAADDLRDMADYIPTAEQLRAAADYMDDLEGRWPRLRTRITELEAENADLHRWKAEAVEVLAAWDEVADLIPMRPGDSKAAAVKAWIEHFA